MSLNLITKKIIELRNYSDKKITLLAVCPNSESVLAAAVKAASKKNSVMLFAATLNQVDFDNGYTGWTPQEFVKKISHYSKVYNCHSKLYPCLDHGGPWLKDKDRINNLNFEQTFDNVKKSIESCLLAGYSLLHIDPTVNKMLPEGEIVTIDWIVEKTVELIRFSESIRERFNLPEVSYEVGTEEVHGGMVDLHNFKKFIQRLKNQLEDSSLSHVWPCFFVAQVGTDLHTTDFNPQAAKEIFTLLEPMGALAKGHYTDWVSNPQDYPLTGMGGANVGPEFTSVEYDSLSELENIENEIHKNGIDLDLSNFSKKLAHAVIESNRWKKWLFEEENGLKFQELKAERQLWLLQSGSRYIWTNNEVVEARKQLLSNVSSKISNPKEFIIDKISISIERYIDAFNLTNSSEIFSEI